MGPPTSMHPSCTAFCEVAGCAFLLAHAWPPSWLLDLIVFGWQHDCSATSNNTQAAAEFEMHSSNLDGFSGCGFVPRRAVDNQAGYLHLT